MNAHILAVSMVMGLLTLITFGVVFRFKNRFSSMTGMTVAMGTGMNVGLTIGALMGVIFQEQLLLSTVLSMAIGMGAGLLVGYPIHNLAAFNGLWAGMMGGMMGAMIGEMLSLQHALVLIQIMMTVSCSTGILLIVMSIQELKKNENVTSMWLLRPLTVFIVLFILFIGIQHLIS